MAAAGRGAAMSYESHGFCCTGGHAVSPRRRHHMEAGVIEQRVGVVVPPSADVLPQRAPPGARCEWRQERVRGGARAWVGCWGARGGGVPSKGKAVATASTGHIMRPAIAWESKYKVAPVRRPTRSHVSFLNTHWYPFRARGFDALQTDHRDLSNTCAASLTTFA